MKAYKHRARNSAAGTYHFDFFAPARVSCALCVSTFIFDTDGTRCTEFDPEQFLKHPLTAFVAGDFTTSSGSTEPSLIYVSTGGDVVVYHGLVEQVRGWLTSLRSPLT